MTNSTFKKEDFADFRLNLALKKVGQKLLLEILKYALPKEPRETYHEYLSKHGNFNHKKFDASQREKLKKDESGKDFDITLIFKLIINGCANIHPQSHSSWKTVGEFEHYLGRIKNIRNDLVHSSSPIPYEELNDRMVRLKEIFTGLIKTAQTRFEIDSSVVQGKIIEIEDDLQIILSSPLNQTDVDEFLVTEGVQESKSRYKKLSFVNPVDFFLGVEFSTKIDDVFITLEINELESHKRGKRISLENLLKSFFSNDISLLIVEGLAGSGKTTLSKFILSKWRENSSVIYGLRDFTFVLYLQCSNIYINSVYDLIASILPETSRRFQKEELIESIFCKKLLVVVDGIDEAHAGTKAVLKELFHRCQSKDIKFFCTSRPEKVHWVYRIKGNLKCGALSIAGIPSEDRISFVKKLYTYYSNIIQNEVICPLNKVIRILKNLSSTFINPDLKLPLFLALFAYLCTVEPDKVEGMNSLVSLYEELIIALRERLLTRSLTKNENAVSPQDEDDIVEGINSCFHLFCEEALVSLVEDKETFSQDSLIKIKKNSSAIGLTAKDVLSAFQVVKIVLTPFGFEEVVGFPHKGLKEFLAAKAAVQKIQDGCTITSIFCANQEQNSGKRPSHLDLNTNLIKYQTIIPYLSGILVKKNILTDEYANEILKLFRKTGAYLSTQWLSLLVALDFHYLACEFVLMKFKKLDIKEDYLDTLLALLNYKSPKELIIRIETGLNYTEKLKRIFTLLNNFECNIKLIMRHSVRYPRKKCATNLLNVLNTKHSR